MSKEYYLVDTHGGHNFNHRPPDDGLQSPYENVAAARKKGVIPVQSSHNSMRAIGAYWDAMDAYGYGSVKLPGVELSFYSQGAGFTTAGRLADSNQQVMLYAGTDSKRFSKRQHSGQEHNIRLRQENIVKSREFINHTITEFMASIGVPEDRILPEISKGFWSLEIAKILTGDVNEADDFAYRAAIGIWTALAEPGFAAFYSMLHDSYESDVSSDVYERLQALKEFPDMVRIIELGWIFWDKEYAKERKETFKGEIICLMPQSPGLVAKVANLVESWRLNGYHKTLPLTTLFDFFDSNLTQEEYAALVWNFPHPVSIDITWPGKQIVHVMEGDVSLFAPELLNPEIAAKIDTIEVYNAAHPGATNQIAGEIAGIQLLKQKGRTGGSDSHHPSWVGAGATLVEVDELSTDGILDALRRGNTLPISGLGKASTTILPFIAWSLTIPIKGKNFTPAAYFQWLREQTDVRTPASRAIEMNTMHDPTFTGWVY